MKSIPLHLLLTKQYTSAANFIRLCARLASLNWIILNITLSHINHLINMATQTSSSTTNVTVSQTQPEIYNSKWGNVIILDRQNYPTFTSTCRATLIIAGAWNLVQGTEAMLNDLTTENRKDWAIHRGRALQIMFNSTSEGIRDTLDTFISNQDAPGL